MDYDDKVASLIDTYLFDDMETWTQDQFDDLEWKKVVTKQWMKKLPKGQSETPVRGNKKYLASWAGGLGTPNSVSILSADDIHSHNAHSVMVLDAGYFHSYAEIPKKGYFFDKFYKDKYSSIKEATTALLKKYADHKAKQKRSSDLYNKKWNIIDNASFFAITKLEAPLKMELEFNDIPVVYEDKQVGTAVVVEYENTKTHFAITLNSDFKNFDHKDIGKIYQVDYQIECKDEEDSTYIVDVKKVIISKI